MRRYLYVLPLLLLLGACDLGLGTEPVVISLDMLGPPSANSAVVMVSEPLGDGRGYYDMAAGVAYAFQLRTPPPLPQMIYDLQVGVGSAALRLDLANIEETGTLVTGEEGVDVLFIAPNGATYEPLTTCRITITTPWSEQAGTRFQGRSDCPVTDGTAEFRVLFSFDYTVPAG